MALTGLHTSKLHNGSIHIITCSSCTCAPLCSVHYPFPANYYFRTLVCSQYFLSVFSLVYGIELHSKTIHRSEEFIKSVEKQFVTKLFRPLFLECLQVGENVQSLVLQLLERSFIHEEIQSYSPQNFMVMNIPHPIIYYNTDFHWFLFMDIIIHEFEV